MNKPRRSPVRHAVRQHRREGRIVRHYMRGSGYRIPERRRPSPSYLGIGSVSQSDYRDFLGGSIHGGFVVRKEPSAVSLSLVPVRRDELDYFTSNRPDFIESKNYWIDMIRRGETIPPILVHKLPNGRFMILDGQARCAAYDACGISQYPAVENSIADVLRKGAAKAQGAIERGADYAATKTHDLAWEGMRAGKEYAKEAGKSLAFEARERTKENLAGLKKSAKGFYEETKKRGKENLLGFLQQGEVKRLLAQAASKDAYTSTKAKQLLRSRYPIVWENSPYSEKVSIVKHINVSGKGYQEEVAEQKQASVAKQASEGERQVRKLKAQGKEIPQNLLIYDPVYRAEQAKKKEAAERKSLLEERTHQRQLMSLAHPPQITAVKAVEKVEPESPVVHGNVAERDTHKTRKALKDNYVKFELDRRGD